MKVKVVHALLQGNDNIAKTLRDQFKKSGIFVFNVISSPGAGKTTLLQNLISIMSSHLRIGVIVGDIEDSVDAERIATTGVHTIQLNTKGACHLDAGMIKNSLNELPMEALDLLIIENVGNLVCPSDFDLGEDLKIVILSTTEGDDKPKKYPTTFLKAHVVIFNKIDLLPFTNFSIDKAKNDISQINPRIKFFETTATKKETLLELTQYIINAVRWKRERVER